MAGPESAYLGVRVGRVRAQDPLVHLQVQHVDQVALPTITFTSSNVARWPRPPLNNSKQEYKKFGKKLVAIKVAVSGHEVPWYKFS